jgi:hypothetical protein
MEGGRKFKFLFYFMETTHELLHLHKLCLIQQNIMEISTRFIRIMVLFDEVFRGGDGAKFRDYVGTNAKPLCV